MAFIIPNSFVLSLTDMSNVFIIPKALMINAIAITVIRSDLAEPARFITVPMTWVIVTAWMSGIFSISSATWLIWLTSLTLIAMVVILPVLLKTLCASARGTKWKLSS
ncbi:Uncharacterised protein [uncultured archaeon]|nr:Uncharacterised protein [uncultured archaeon]